MTSRGRPPIGQVIEVRLDDAILQALYFYMKKSGAKSRAAAIRELLELELRIVDCEYCGRGVAHGEFCERPNLQELCKCITDVEHAACIKPCQMAGGSVGITEWLRRTGADTTDMPAVVFTCTCEWFPPYTGSGNPTEGGVQWTPGCPVHDEDPMN